MEFNVAFSDEKIASSIVSVVGESIPEQEWKALAKELGLHQHFLHSLEKDLLLKSSSAHDLYLKMLEDWRRQENRPTIEMFIIHLKNIQWTGVAELLELQLKVIDDTEFQSVASLQVNMKAILGAGAFGKVCLGKFQDTMVAVKVIPKSLMGEEKEIGSEIKGLLACSDHENVVKYLCMEEDETWVYIALEFCHCTLRKWITTDRKCVAPATILEIDILQQMTSGLDYIHRNNVVHRDLKPDNILFALVPPSQVRVKVGDFGTSQIIPLERSCVTMTSVQGTLRWMAPEILKCLDDRSGVPTLIKLTKKCDIFVLGCLFYYVLTGGDHPFGNSIIRCNVNILLNNLEHFEEKRLFTPEIERLVRIMISANPDERPETHEILSAIKRGKKKATSTYLV